LLVAMQRPARIASLTLYEPTAFGVLARMGAPGATALQEIRSVARTVDKGLLSGAYQAAAQRFVDYWNGSGTWASLEPAAQAKLIRYVPKACLDFRALLSASMPLHAYRCLQMPILLLRGEYAPRPTALIAQHLQVAGRRTNLVTVPGAGHMGPSTNAVEVARLICEHILVSEAATVRRLVA
jgi:pimeloyl-ACP methyl ester carboxylesterase